MPVEQDQSTEITMAQTGLKALTEKFRDSSLPIVQKFRFMENFVKSVKLLPLTIEDIDDLLESIELTDFSSKRLKLELASYFRRFLIILEYLQTGEKLLVKRSLQFSWIFKDFEGSPSLLIVPKTLVRVILPSISYSTRVKILQRLGKFLKNEAISEQTFELVKQMYGTGLALCVLPACSSEFISNLLNTDNYSQMNLGLKRALKIAKKDHNLGFQCLNFAIKESEDSDADKVIKYRMSSNNFTTIVTSIFRYLSRQHTLESINFYLRQHTNAQQKLHLAVNEKRLTFLVRNEKKLILDHPTELYSFFEQCPKILAENLSWDEYVNLVAAIIPDSEEAFDTAVPKLSIKAVGQQKGWEFIKTLYYRKFNGRNISDQPDIISASFMKYMPPIERENLAIYKIKREKNAEPFWTSFMTLENSIPKLKMLLKSSTDIATRATLIGFLSKSCWINGRNKNSMIEIGEFILDRYRNGAAEIRSQFLFQLSDKVNLDRFMDENVYKLLGDFIRLSEIYNEPTTTHSTEKITMSCIGYAIIHEKSIENFMETYLKDFICLRTILRYNTQIPLLISNREIAGKFYRLCALKIIEEFFGQDTLIEQPVDQNTPEWESESKLDLQMNTSIALLEANANLEKGTESFRSAFQIDDFPQIKSFLEDRCLTRFVPSSLKQYSNCCSIDKDEKTVKRILYLVKSIKSPSFFIDKIVQFYTNIVLPSNPEIPILNRLMRTSPSTILEKVPTIVKCILAQKQWQCKTYGHFFMQLKTRGFPKITSEIAELCLEMAQDDDKGATLRQNALFVLSYIWDSTNYLNIVTMFYPSNPRLELSSTEKSTRFEERYDVRRTIIKSLIHQPNAYTCLEPIGHFCKGDYLKASVKPLYSLCIHSSPKQAIEFLKTVILPRGVSVKKHGINLLSRITDLQEAEELLSSLWTQETHISIKVIIIKHLIQLLNQNHSNKTFETVKTAIQSLTIFHDYECFEELILRKNIKTIPQKFILPYLTTIYETFDSAGYEFHENCTILQSFTNALIKYGNPALTTTLRLRIINKFFFQPLNTSIDHRGINTLVIDYLLQSNEISSQQQQTTRFIIEKLILLKQRWNINTNAEEPNAVQCYTARIQLSQFITQLIRRSSSKLLLDPTSDQVQPLFQSLLSTIESDFDPEDTFSGRILLKLFLIFLPIMQSVESKDHQGPADLHESVSQSCGKNLRDLTISIMKKYHSVILDSYITVIFRFMRLVKIDFFSEDQMKGAELLQGLLIPEQHTGDIILENLILTCKIFDAKIPNSSSVLEIYRGPISTLLNCGHPEIKICLNLWMNAKDHDHDDDD